MWHSECLLFILCILLVLYILAKRHYSYWQNKNVPHIGCLSIFGNLKEIVLMRASTAEHMFKLYNHKVAQDQPFVGIHVFNKPALLVREPELIKIIMIKDFNKFSNRFSSSDPHADTLGSYNLFFLKNPYWKELRTKLTPVFSSGKIKQMFPLIQEIGTELDKYLCRLQLDPNTDSCTREVKEISALYSTDVIATVAYGVRANSLENPKNDFRRYGKPLFDFTFYRAFVFSVIFFMPQYVKLFRCKLFPKPTAEFYRDTFNFVMRERLRSGQQRNDLIDILIAFRKAAAEANDSNHFGLNNEMLVAQAGVFFTAGFETASATMSFVLYELSRNPDIQKRLRLEIAEHLAKYAGKVTYEMQNEMEYLNMVIQETLRLYPPLPFLDRECTLANDETEFSMQPFSHFSVPNGMPLYIPIYAIQRDPKYFPDPERFDPERFSSANKSNLVPLTYMPFGVGPHGCIAERFGMLQTKIGLINFLRNHVVTTCEKSLIKTVFEPKALTLQLKGGIYCRLVRDAELK